MAHVTIAKHAGFCFGVKRATDCVEALIDTYKGKAAIYTVGELIHNPIYIKQLEERGVCAISLSEAEAAVLKAKAEGIPCIFVIRAHGIPKEDEARLLGLRALYEGFSLHDMTCPFVKKIHRIASEETNEESLFALLGSPDHPEVKGIMSYAEGEAVASPRAEEIFSFISLRQNDEKKVILAAQTTQNIQEWKKTQKFIKKLCTNAKIFDTICDVTEKRQSEAAALSAACDAMVVVGGRDSSNTRKLYEICRENCTTTLWIESVKELPKDFPPKNIYHVGIAAGASTPSGIIMEVYKVMSENFAELLEESLKTLHTGETVTGIVTEINKTEVYLDLGAKVTGIIAYDQITDEANVDLNTLFKVGDEVTAFVIRVDDGKGVATLSKKRVDNDKAWQTVIALSESGEAVEGKIVDAIKGGLLIDIDGTRVFIPASQSDLEKGADLSVLVGTTQKVRIIEVDRQKKRAVASIRAIRREERKAKEAEIRATLEVGQHFTGTVKTLVNYGAFVDIGGVDGMVHNTELSWKKIKHPSQVVSVGQQIEVFIKELSEDKTRISLGYKTQEMDDFYQFAKAHSVGEVMEAKVVSITPFGAFAEVAPGVDGLIHISKISLEKVNSVEEVLSVGQVVTVKITAIDEENRKISLSIRALLEEARRAEEKAAYEQEKAEKLAERKAAEEEEAALRAEMAPYIVKTIN
ncbi:MAG: bifunctional 4-hydroxy-3-methylbut-2-enyl diphosphate reductase/30S ribosomal protein S1 [Clostridia bacterium]|nr:bifunctional 4-hydroxy-3-methylbut-2-enyl diphosphate reductase/30S ribosomal protein S1 [Clostridia bacterium]